MKQKLLKTNSFYCLLFAIVLVAILSSCAHRSDLISKNLTYKKHGIIHVLEGVNFNKISPRNSDGTMNAVIEIPSGSNKKWEVKRDGKLYWDTKHGDVRYVDYLAYPGNYGMIPQTKAGDGDPLDVLILGPAQPRGKIVKVNIIGVLKALDKGERDDKLVAVFDPSELSEREKEITGLHNINSIKELNKKYPGATDIISIFFQYYKRNKNGKPKMKIIGYTEFEDAADMRESLR